MDRRSAEAPVFFDCEASSLDGYIIEVGWAFVSPAASKIVSAGYLIRPAPDWKIKDAWSRNSEKIHGISLDDLRQRGRPVEEIAEVLNRELAGRELFSDDWTYDEGWLMQVFEAARTEPFFTISHINARELVEQMAAQQNFDLMRLREAIAESKNGSSHRAEADARDWAEIWRMVIKTSARQS